MLIKIINENKRRWYEMDTLDVRDMEIQKIINDLDKTAIKYEQKWGIGTLQNKCSQDLLQKWHNQCDKFTEAMQRKDVDLIRILTSGFKRAYEALEKDLLGKGINPPEMGKSLIWEMQDGFKIIVCENHDDLRVLTAKYSGQDCEIWTIKEVAEFIDKHGRLVNILENKKKQPEITNLQEFDFKKGDEIEFN